MKFVSQWEEGENAMGFLTILDFVSNCPRNITAIGQSPVCGECGVNFRREEGLYRQLQRRSHLAE